jgi:amino acid transporter
LLYDLTAILYLLMYLLLFSAFIRLRFKKPNIERPFKIPFKSFGMWSVGTIAILGVMFLIIIGFFPPTQIHERSVIFYELFLIGGVLLFAVIPLVFHRMHHKTWKKALAKEKDLIK